MNHVKTVVRDPGSKKRAILAAARRLLVSRGFQDSVLDDVAREAGVAKGGASVPDLRFAAMAFVGLCRTATMRKVVEKHERKLERDAEAVVGFFLEGSGVGL